jgi:hypothetical protein
LPSSDVLWNKCAVGRLYMPVSTDTDIMNIMQLPILWSLLKLLTNNYPLNKWPIMYTISASKACTCLSCLQGATHNVPALIIIHTSRHSSSVVAANETEGKDIYFGPNVDLYSIPKIYYHTKFQDPTFLCSATVLSSWNSAWLLHWSYWWHKIEGTMAGYLYWHEGHAKGHENHYNGLTPIRENGHMDIIFPHQVKLTG